MPRRLKLIVAYDGAPFSGWQSQRGGNTVQDHIEGAFRVVTNEVVRVHGAGRTDAGVHALGQCAHADASGALAPSQWIAALNGSLPPAIRVVRCGHVAGSFHARFSAKGKTYRYRIWNARILPPLEYARAWHVPAALDFSAMERAAAAFVGRHDFASFAANRGKPEHDTRRTIDAVHLRSRGPCIIAEFSGEGFLYKMVRLMVGALVRAGRRQAAEGEVRERLLAPARAPAGARFAAPAGGLYLLRVRY